MGCGRPPRHLYLKNFYGSPDYKYTNLHYRKMELTKTIIQGMLNLCSTFCLKKIDFLAGGVRAPPPIIADISAKKSIFFTPSLTARCIVAYRFLLYVLTGKWDVLQNHTWNFKSSKLRHKSN